MIEAALYSIPANDRDTWVTCGMAIKSELGDSGYEIWDRWSQQADNYKPSAAKSVWRSIKQGGGITIRTLYKLARDHGYQGDAVIAPSPQSDRSRVQAEAALEMKRRQEAADRAADMLKRAPQSWHPYLVSKGFPQEQGFILDECLLIPMRDVKTHKINSLQMIDSVGTKKFLPGGKAKGSVFILGSGQQTWLVEGYVSGLSLRLALRSMYRPDRVIVCFSAVNLTHVASGIGKGFIYADNDESKTGELAAIKSGLPWVMSDRVGNDVNDDHQQFGLKAVANRILDAMRSIA